MAERARPHYDQVLVGDIETDALTGLQGSRFDVIVCADVLGHLKRPTRTLGQLKEFLSDKGVFLISVANVAFISMRLSLLMGQFNYQKPGGILDDDHLRHFTLRGLKDTLSEAGLETVSVRGYNLVRRRYFFLKALGWLFPALFCIQFLAVARRRLNGGTGGTL